MLNCATRETTALQSFDRVLRFARTVVPLIATLLIGGAARCEESVTTLVFIRHGEKPDAGLGQLNCQGLNRALALPRVIFKSFGKPDFIIVPNPASQKKDKGELYDYVRPLATAEPTAISFGLPVMRVLTLRTRLRSRRLSKIASPLLRISSYSLFGSTRASNKL